MAGWKVLAGINRDTALAPVDAALRRNALLYLLALLLAIGLSFAVGRRIARPVLMLAQATRTFTAGNRAAPAPAGRETEIAGIATDVGRMLSTLRATEADLRASETRFKLAVRAANIALWDWDLTSDRVYYSPEWKHQLGYEDDEIGDDLEAWSSRVHPDQREAALRIVAGIHAGDWPRDPRDARLRHKDGSYRWIQIRAEIMKDSEGKPLRMLGCNIDITARKRDEALVEGQRRILESIASGAPLEQSLDRSAVGGVPRLRAAA